jgi:hypothetical protein
MKKTTQQKQRKPRMSFAEKLAEKLKHLGEVEHSHFYDNSGAWVQLKVKDITLSIGFDMKGENIDGIGLFKDVVEVVDQKQLWRI